MPRHDYAFPFRIDASSRQAGQSSYEAHVAQMVRQVLLTAPGERVNLPEFGCGLRALVFAANSDALSATTQILVQHALTSWLSGIITVHNVQVLPPAAAADENEIRVLVEYALVSTGAAGRVEVRVT